jgi:hypothetical protein
MSADELMEVVEARMRARGNGCREKLDAAGLLAIARTLAGRTANVWGFLCWLADLDYVAIDFDPGDDKALRSCLDRFSAQRFTGVDAAERARLAAAFEGCRDGYLSAAALAAAGVEDELLDRAARYGVLVPDWLLSPDRYLLAPGLHYLCPA